MKALLILLPLVLTACQGSDNAAVITALGQDTGDVCAVAHNTFAPYQGDITICRSNSTNGGTVTTTKDGSVTITRNPPTAKP